MTVRVLEGDCRDVLGTLPDRSVQCCATSPPYFGLRDYGVDGQLGLEPTVEAYVANLVAVFREVWRVLRDDGTVWLNLGDSYARGGGRGEGRLIGTKQGTNRGSMVASRQYPPDGIKPKDLIGVPWRVAFALQADGWYLRSDIIWAKPNPMPESVRDRPTKAHEYLFLLSKRPRYFFDAEAVKEDTVPLTKEHYERYRGKYSGVKNAPERNDGENAGNVMGNGQSRNIRTVWTIATAPYAQAHFATFPPALVEPCVKAGTSEKGACPSCGAPWVRVVELETNWQERKANGAWAGNVGVAHNYQNNVHGNGMSHDLGGGATRHVGWQPSCTCDAGDPVPCVVLDPFGGAGTVGLVADRLGRDAILVELNPEYAAMSRKRIAGDAPLFAEVL